MEKRYRRPSEGLTLSDEEYAAVCLHRLDELKAQIEAEIESARGWLEARRQPERMSDAV